ncbi:MAG: hypothetical protein KKG59_06945 [Nanoarchaeota archaeon]|nr:hypothetical protein [Nanoarchaeota archaeon]
MALRFTSLKTSMFLLIYLAILIPLLVLSVIAINVFESKITSIEEEHLMRNARIIEMTYESHQNDLLKAGLILSKNPDFTSHSSHEAMKFHLANLLHIEELDIASVVDMEGMTVASATTEEVGFMHEFEGLLLNSIQNGIPMVSTEVIKSNELVFENSDLLLDTETRRIPTLYQRENDVEEHIENGLGIVAVIPVFHNHTVKYYCTCRCP